MYDAFGNLLSVRLPSKTITYGHDAANRRTAKLVDGAVIRRWIYSDDLKIVGELDATGATVSRFVYATRVNVPDYMIRGLTTWRLITDERGSVRAVINTTTGAVDQYLRYDDFGVLLEDSNPGFQPFGFAGGLYDPDTNLVRFGARDYDPRVGRWTGKDPIGFAGGDVNVYVYTGGDPVNYTDPTGLDALTADPDALAIMASLFKKAGYGQVPYEQNALILRNPQTGKYSCLLLPSSHEANRNTFTNVPHPWRVAYIHTHPNGRTVLADRGSDPAAAATLGIPLYALSRAGIHKIDPHDSRPHDTEEINANTYRSQNNNQDWWNAPDANNCGCH